MTEILSVCELGGSQLSQTDFAMSKIAANDTFGGNPAQGDRLLLPLRQVTLSTWTVSQRATKPSQTPSFFQAIRWLKGVNDDIYDPSYTDMLRVAFAGNSAAASCRTSSRCSLAATSRPSKMKKRSPRRRSAN